MASSRRLLRQHWLASLVGFVIVLAVAWRATSYWRGTLAARYDLAHDRYEILGYGYPAPFVPEGRRMLRDRYGVKLRWVAGCMISSDFEDWVHGYNSVSKRQLAARFGKDVEDECMREAMAAYIAAHR